MWSILLDSRNILKRGEPLRVLLSPDGGSPKANQELSLGLGDAKRARDKGVDPIG